MASTYTISAWIRLHRYAAHHWVLSSIHKFKTFGIIALPALDNARMLIFVLFALLQDR